MSGMGGDENYLKPFLGGSPSSAALLAAAWDGLSVETQIKLLHALGASVPADAGRKAAESPNEYVRFLAARAGFVARGETSPLALSAAEPASMPGPGDFASLSPERQLFLLSGPSAPSAEEFIAIVQAADGKVTDDRLVPLIAEYTHQLAVRYRAEVEESGKYFWMGGPEEVESLWRFMAALPAARSAARKAFVAGLPVQRGSGVFEEPLALDDVLRGLPEDELVLLLNRADVGQGAFRERLFLADDTPLTVRRAAMAHNLRLSDDVFGKLLAGKSPLLADLARTYAGSMVFLEALKDHFAALGDFENASAAHKTFMERIGEFNGYFNELRRHKIYRLAKEVAPWGSDSINMDYLPAPLAHLAPSVVKGDTWATYCKLKAGVGYNLRFEKILPAIREVETGAEARAEPPDDPEELFRGDYPDGVFLEEKINFIGRRLIENRAETEKTAAAVESARGLVIVAVVVSLLSLAALAFAIFSP